MTINDTPVYPVNDDRTIFIPRPGGRSVGGGPAAEPVQPRHDSPIQSYTNMNSINPLVGAGSILLEIAAQLRNTLKHGDVIRLRSSVLQEVKAFENSVRLAGIETDISHTARFILCAYIDEVVLNTIWGSNSTWGEQSLLSTLYNETRGGEVFFVVLDRLLKDPNPNINLLELIFICISLGYKGRYGALDRGPEELEELRGITFERIRQIRGEFPQELSPHWRGQTNTRRNLRTIIPLWVVAAVAGVLLLAVYFGFSLILNESAKPTQQSLEQLAVPPSVQKDNNR